MPRAHARAVATLLRPGATATGIQPEPAVIEEAGEDVLQRQDIAESVNPAGAAGQVSEILKASAHTGRSIRPIMAACDLRSLPAYRFYGSAAIVQS